MIELAASEWAASVALVPKMKAYVLFCVDYHKLNQMISKESYTALLLDDCIGSSGQAKDFHTIDPSSGYWRVNIRQES